jgi:hypothetical protein
MTNTPELQEMLVVIGTRWYKDGLSHSQVIKKLKELKSKEVERITQEYYKCLQIPLESKKN